MKSYTITVNGKSYDVDVTPRGMKVEPVVTPAPAPVISADKGHAAASKAPAPAAAPAPKSAPAAGAGNVTAPIPGTVLNVAVTDGQSVAEGDLLLSFEAMKMETELFAPIAGVVEKVFVQKGGAFQAGDLLISIR